MRLFQTLAARLKGGQEHAGSESFEKKEWAAEASSEESSALSIKGVWSDGLGRTGSRALQILLIGLLAWFVIKGLIAVQMIFIAVVVATILACALSPVMRWMKSNGMGKIPATLTTFIGSLLVLCLVIWVVVESVLSQTGTLTQQAIQGFGKVQDWFNSLPFNVSSEQWTQWQNQALEFMKTSNVSQGALTGLSAISSFLTGFILMAVCLFFFLLDGPRMWAFVVDFSPRRHAQKLREAGAGTVRVLGQYVRGTAAVASIDAVFIGAGLLILQVPLAIPLAIITFLGAFVPVVGAVVGGIIAVLVALVTKGVTTAIIIAIIVVLVQQIEGNILQPRLMGDALSLHGLVILLTLAAGSSIGGIAGAVLAVPMAAVVWEWIKVYRGRGAPVMPEDIHKEKKREEKKARKELKKQMRKNA